VKILNSTCLHGWSAASWYALEMMRGLAERGHDVFFLVPDGRTADRARSEGFEVRTEPDLRRFSPRRLRAVATGLRRLAAGIEPDLILAHAGPDQLWWALAGERSGPPLVRVRSHDPRPPARHPFALWLNQWATSAFIVANEHQRRDYVRRCRVEPGRVWRLPPGFDPTGWRNQPAGDPAIRAVCGIDPTTLLVASIARFAPQKDHPTFFAAAAAVAERFGDVHFLAAGYPAEYTTDRIRSLASRYRALDGRVTIWDERLDTGRALVSAADIGVIHSAGSEAVCRVALEYMAEAIPIAATRIGALDEVLQDNESGLLVPPGEPDALAGAIGRLLAVSGLRERLSQAATERLGARFDPVRAVERFEYALEQIAGR